MMLRPTPLALLLLAALASHGLGAGGRQGADRPATAEPHPLQDAREARAAARDRDAAAQERAQFEEDAAARRADDALTAAQVSEAQRLDAVTEEICSALFVRRPWLARELGRNSHDGWLAPFDAAQHLSWETALDAAGRKLARVRGSLLPPDRLPDLLWLSALLDAESIARSALPTFREDPGLYVRHASGSLSALLEARHIAATERAAAVVRWCVELPALWDAARRNLTSTVRPWTEIAAEEAQDLREATAVVAAAVLQNPELDEEERKRGEAALERALASLDEFHTYLTVSVRPLGRDTYAMNPERWRQTLERLTGAPIDLKALEVQLLRDIARYDRARAALPRRPATPQLDAMEAWSAAATATAALVPFGARVGLAVPPGPGFVTSPSRPGFAYGPLASWRPGALAPGVLVLGLPSRHWSGILAGARGKRFTQAGVRALVLRYGPLGEWALRVRNTRSLLPGRIALENFPLRTGFGLYTTDWVVRVPTLAAVLDDRTRSELLLQRSRAALQLYAALQLHGHQVPFLEVHEEWMFLSGDDPETATRNLVPISRQPFSGAGYLAYIELLRLERELRGQLPDWVAALKVVGLVAANPCARPVDLLNHLDELSPGLREAGSEALVTGDSGVDAPGGD